mgnify:CR=1 FL=1
MTCALSKILTVQSNFLDVQDCISPDSTTNFNLYLTLTPAGLTYILTYSCKVITVLTTPARSAFAVTLISQLATPLTTHPKRQR